MSLIFQSVNFVGTNLTMWTNFPLEKFERIDHLFMYKNMLLGSLFMRIFFKVSFWSQDLIKIGIICLKDAPDHRCKDDF